MQKHQWLLITFILMALLVLSGCGDLFGGGEPEDTQALVNTQVAQTLQAQAQLETIVASTLAAMPPAVDEVPEETEPEQPTLAPTATATLSPTEMPVEEATLTPTSTLTLAEVSVPTNCRTGPSRDFDQVSVLGLRQQVEVVARNADSTYWVVQNPGGAGTCWLWGRYATITGPTANLPVWESPPLPTPQATPGVVTLRVSVPTNCRIGPGKPFDIVTILRPGTTATVVARHGTADFWVIENPAGAGTCWVWGKYAILSGSAAHLPVWTAPAAPTPQVTPSAVTLKVRVDTNCRTGPGRPYDIVTILRIGKTATVVARHGTADFWVIENPDGAGTCWVWGEYATLTGPASSLPVWTAPPLPTPQATPAAVTLKVSVDTNCRTGPGKPHPIVTIFRIGMTGEVVARNAASTFWAIRNPIGSGHCWVWGKYATLTGSTSSLPVW